jgi:hypothetical protein
MKRVESTRRGLMMQPTMTAQLVLDAMRMALRAMNRSQDRRLFIRPIPFRFDPTPDNSASYFRDHDGFHRSVIGRKPSVALSRARSGDCARNRNLT